MRDESSGFDSLQELLEREGYKETRIVTPITKPPPMVSIDDMDEDTDTAGTSPTIHTREGYTHIHSWMEGMLAAQARDAPSVPTRRALHTSQSDAALAQSVRRRRSVLWDASRAYRSGAPASAAPTAQAAPPLPTPPLAFLAEPAKPVVSRADAVARHEDAPRSPRKSIRRTKSQDLLHKALKSRSAGAPPPPPPPQCTCGRTEAPRSALSWRKPPAAIAPQWHAHDCPVRIRWEHTAPAPVPPPPPKLYVSSPSGISAPRHLELQGHEFDANNPNTRDLQRLFPRIPRPRLALVKRATIAGLYGLFRAPDTISDPQRLMAPSGRRTRSQRKHRAPRVMSVPHLRRTSTEVRLVSTPPRVLRTAEMAPAVTEIAGKVSTPSSPSTGKENLPEDVACATPPSPTLRRTTAFPAMRRVRSMAPQRKPAPPLPADALDASAPSAADAAPRLPSRVASRPQLDYRKSSKTRPAPRAEAPAEERAPLGTRTDYVQATEPMHTEPTLRRAPSSKVLRLQRKPSAMALGLGLALPTPGAPGIFAGSASSERSGRDGSARTRPAVPPVPPLPQAYAPEPSWQTPAENTPI
ncbi:hypothetical protein MBRA1_000979 [Malassezia brasiliensis]|uniref:Uncharacterized protein n=1 Tax=Malassezia brasiliensis TaxID=1821822 RepID=A0AAF0IMT1_9BASI|nr:hypothetical protein MBRA1_000979 [Malassezia brasiliensis]